MKKIVTSLLCGSILCTACALGACGASAEERFKTATQSFDNYTAQVTMEVVVGTSTTYNYYTFLEIDGKEGKANITRDNTTMTIFLKEENGSVYVYENSRSGWTEYDYHSIEEVIADANHCYLEIFQSIFFNETEEEGGYFCLKDNVLAAYSETLGFTLTSARVKLSGSKFTSAEVVGSNSGGGRFHVEYTFSKYGSTSVTLPT